MEKRKLKKIIKKSLLILLLSSIVSLSTSKYRTALAGSSGTYIAVPILNFNECINL